MSSDTSLSERSPADDSQVGGAHYKIGGEEHWTRAYRLGLDYFQAQVTKYVERCWKKHGITDLEKAAHFLQKYIELCRAAGRRGAAEAPPVDTQAQERLNWVLRNWVLTTSGQIHTLDGAVLNCLKGSPTDFIREGHYADGRTLWTCCGCGTKVFTPPEVFWPHAIHDCGTEPTAAYVNQDR